MPDSDTMATTHLAHRDPRVAAPNQPPPLAGLNTFETDTALGEALEP